MTDRVARILLALAASFVVITLAATACWAVITLAGRPLDGVEGDVLFEAQRIHEGRALYTDPAAGVFDYGTPPARYLVLYPPLWSALIALAPIAQQAILGRVVAVVAWFGVLVWIAGAAPKKRRRLAALGAAFVGGTWLLGLYGASARPDALAVCLSGLAIERASRRERLDFVSGVLFALAAWMKPNVVGAAPGAFLACAFVAFHAAGAKGRVGRIARAAGLGLFGVVATSVVAAGVLSAVSGRAWIDHLLASTGQPPSLALFAAQLRSRLPFFALPLGAAIAVGLRSRRDPGAAIATGALVSSTLWAIVCLAKIGSAANYFMEPCVAALVVLTRARLPVLELRSARLAVVIACAAQIVHNGLASVRSAAEATTAAFDRARTLAGVRTTCGAPGGSVVLADEPGLELMLNGRIVQTPFQSTHLARRGRFPVEAWITDVGDPHVACLVMQDDLIERPSGVVSLEHDRFGPELRQALALRFERVETRSGYLIYRAKR